MQLFSHTVLFAVHVHTIPRVYVSMVDTDAQLKPVVWHWECAYFRYVGAWEERWIPAIGAPIFVGAHVGGRRTDGL